MELLQGEPFGKLERSASGDVIRWLPLVDHMVDVGRCFERLCRCRAINRALSISAQRELDQSDIQRLAVLAFLHDLGKASSGFQSKRWAAEKRPAYWPFPSGHGAQVVYLLTHEDVFKSLIEALPIEELVSWGEASVVPLLFASISHHGRPIVENSDSVHRVSKNDWKTVRDSLGVVHYDPLITVKQITLTARALYPAAFSPAERQLPDTPAFGHLFAGLVQFADWLGSDTRHFPIRLDDDRGQSSRDYAEQAITALGLDVDHWRAGLRHREPGFKDVFEISSPHPIQTAMGDDALGPLVILESETGSGKTEAALWRFVTLFRAGLVDSLYFALPTRVSAKQVYDRVRSAVAHLWPEDPPITVRALPGYAAVDGLEPEMLPDFEVQWPDEPGDLQALRRWAAEAPKRFLAAPVAVGTIDQALLGILKVKHAHMRYALLSRSLLVVDEVHASDAYMTVLLERLLKAHLDNGGHALLLSATLGSSARTRYLTLGKYGAQPPSFDAAVATDYPSVSDRNGLRGMTATGHKKTVHWSLRDCIDDPDAIAEQVIDAARSGAKVLVVRNTVPAALSLFRAIESHVEAAQWLFHVNGQATLHHSRFSRQDRPLLDAAIETELGKKRPPGPRILIGTQTLEQSLDIDADLLITDLCPMDVLLQRIGRLHRHRRDPSERPVAWAKTTAVVLTPANHDLTPMLTRPAHGLGRFSDGGGVYPDLRVVEATRRLIQEHSKIYIPDDNRKLVEGATHPQCLAEIEAAMGETWGRHGQDIVGDTGANRTIAHLHVLEINQEFAGDPNMIFPSDHKIGTRLGAEDRLIQFDSPIESPFGELFSQIPIRAHLLPRGLPLDAEPDAIETSEGVTRFTLGDANFRYSRLGLERVHDA